MNWYKAVRQAVQASSSPQDLQTMLAEYQQYADFGRRLSSSAESLRSGTTSPQDTVRQATKRHQAVLQKLQKRVPGAAQQGIQKALENAQADQAPADSARQNRSDQRRGGQSQEMQEGRQQLQQPESRSGQPASPETNQPSPEAASNATTGDSVGQAETNTNSGNPDGQSGLNADGGGAPGGAR